MTNQELRETIKALRARIMGLERENQELKEQNKLYKQTLEYIQKEIHKAIYTPKKQKWNSDLEREFEKGKTRGLIQASDIVKEAIEILEAEEK